MNKKYSTIAFIIPYFGRFNNYFQLWLKSCAANPTVDWLLFTDDKRDFDYPPNVHVNYTTLGEVKHRVEVALGCHVCLEKPYKLCDFKPFYGIIFAEELKGFDFWGYCDVDLIWGDIRHFLPDDLLIKYDKIFCFGHCTLLRNTSRINHFFTLQAKGVIPWQKVVSEPFFFQYDEFDQINGIFEEHFSNRFYRSSAAFDARYDKRSLLPSKATKKIVGVKDQEYLFRWLEGELFGYYCGKDGVVHEQEFMYLHLQKREMLNTFVGQVSVSSFLILHNRFIRDTEVTAENIHHFMSGHSLMPYKLKESIRHIMNILFDNYVQKPYFRGTVSYWVDKALGRSRKYDYRYRDK